MHPLLPLLALLAAPPDAAVSRALASGAEPGGERAARATAPLLGRPYRLDPLGEGSGPDPDPRFRLDAFDCMTLVETAVALGSSATLDEARRALDDVRYDGPPALAARNHEVLSQWIPVNARKGWIAPASRALAGEAALVEAVEYDAARWDRLARAGRGLRGVPREKLPIGRFEVEVVPEAALLAIERRIPDGTVAFVVRADDPGHVTRVTHAALIVARPDGRRAVRHASSFPSAPRVVEEPLARFLERQRRGAPRRVVGLALFTIRDARERLASLPNP
ncbi:MAG TPA: N-acetylmuramoyl-L-alanine amidase-like domain-containing protein [Anaeromyxobacteraceae bacterium]|nr:N-acetylmuramoyl-L-alanine amidase-like domain-containing protein [Anaeromyxobacteraceae bacterium]